MWGAITGAAGDAATILAMKRSPAGTLYYKFLSNPDDRNYIKVATALTSYLVAHPEHHGSIGAYAGVTPDNGIATAESDTTFLQKKYKQAIGLYTLRGEKFYIIPPGEFQDVFKLAMNGITNASAKTGAEFVTPAEFQGGGYRRRRRSTRRCSAHRKSHRKAHRKSRQSRKSRRHH